MVLEHNARKGWNNDAYRRRETEHDRGTRPCFFFGCGLEMRDIIEEHKKVEVKSAEERGDIILGKRTDIENEHNRQVSEYDSDAPCVASARAAQRQDKDNGRKHRYDRPNEHLCVRQSFVQEMDGEYGPAKRKRPEINEQEKNEPRIRTAGFYGRHTVTIVQESSELHGRYNAGDAARILLLIAFWL